jgi:type II restriction enzyme
MPCLAFDLGLAASYSSPSQRARVLSEHWTHKHVYCPNCGKEALERTVNNSPASDFSCPSCQEVYELKSQKGSFGRKLTDGAYATMIKRLNEANNPNLFLLNYNLNLAQVTNLTVVPKYFLVPDLIEKRKPLADTARRARWIGCNIILQGIPQSGRISLVEAGGFRPKAEVLADWRKTVFVRQQKRLDGRGWLIVTAQPTP